MGSHFVQVALPAGASQLTSLIEIQWLCSQSAQCEVDRVALGSQLIPTHHGGASFVIDVYICVSHTPTIHQPGSRRKEQYSIGRLTSSRQPQFQDQTRPILVSGPENRLLPDSPVWQVVSWQPLHTAGTLAGR